jgi:16S rRNA (guanine966-N2)-methyltransferase
MKPGSVRISGGRLRGSRLVVADRPGLRPTADRVRETLFNWLQAWVPGSRCLDLFAGTGALGFEAASRGAADVLMLEQDRALAAALRSEAARLKASEVRVECTDALAFLDRPGSACFDLVFLDPPFAAGLHQRALDLLAARGWLAREARVYVESPTGLGLSLPPGWEPLRRGGTREVDYALCRALPAAPDTLGVSSDSPSPDAPA